MPGTKIRCAAITPSEMERWSEAERLREQKWSWGYAQDVFSMQRSNSHIRVFAPPVGQAGVEPAVCRQLCPVYSRVPSPLGALTLVEYLVVEVPVTGLEPATLGLEVPRSVR